MFIKTKNYLSQMQTYIITKNCCWVQYDKHKLRKKFEKKWFINDKYKVQQLFSNHEWRLFKMFLLLLYFWFHSLKTRTELDSHLNMSNVSFVEHGNSYFFMVVVSWHVFLCNFGIKTTNPMNHADQDQVQNCRLQKYTKYNFTQD